MNYKKLQRNGFKYSQRMKNKQTRAERILRQWLRSHNICFKQQAYFHDTKRLFIADFRLSTVHDGKVIIEVDGSSHIGKQKYDAFRTKWLKENRNCKVVRFTNREIIEDMPTVINKIIELKPLRVQYFRE